MRPATNGMVERFNGRIEDVLQSHHFRSGEELERTLLRYVRLYNGQLPQTTLKGRTPIEALKDWHRERPELFKKQPYNHPGCDTQSDARGPQPRGAHLLRPQPRAAGSFGSPCRSPTTGPSARLAASRGKDEQHGGDTQGGGPTGDVGCASSHARDGCRMAAVSSRAWLGPDGARRRCRRMTGHAGSPPRSVPDLAHRQDRGRGFSATPGLFAAGDRCHRAGDVTHGARPRPDAAVKLAAEAGLRQAAPCACDRRARREPVAGPGDPVAADAGAGGVFRRGQAGHAIGRRGDSRRWTSPTSAFTLAAPMKATPLVVSTASTTGASRSAAIRPVNRSPRVLA